MKVTNRAWWILFVSILGLGVIGCGDDAGQQPGLPDAATPPPVDGGSGPDAPPGDPTHTWSAIITADWTLAAGQEKYVCATKTLTEDVYLGGFRPIDPVGTHHTLLTFGAPMGADNPGFDCSPGAENPLWIYASGVGTNELMMPTGVGMKIEKGQQVLINLHLFNTSDVSISGKSGIEVYSLKAAEVVDEAEMFLPGPVGFQNAPTTLSGDCTLTGEQHLVALFPHMHQKGRHIKTEVISATAGTPAKVLHDSDYQFDSQEFELLNSVAVHAGDKLRTTCTWDGNGGPINFGSSSTAEMCFSIIIRYPRFNAPGAQGALCFH